MLQHAAPKVGLDLALHEPRQRAALLLGLLHERPPVLRQHLVQHRALGPVPLVLRGARPMTMRRRCRCTDQLHGVDATASGVPATKCPTSRARTSSQPGSCHGGGWRPPPVATRLRGSIGGIGRAKPAATPARGEPGAPARARACVQQAPPCRRTATSARTRSAPPAVRGRAASSGLAASAKGARTRIAARRSEAGSGVTLPRVFGLTASRTSLSRCGRRQRLGRA